MWPATEDELREAQEALAAAEPSPWQPVERDHVVGGCALRHRRGGHDPDDVAGEPAWAAAASLRGGRVLSESLVHGRTEAAYAAGLLALREGSLLEQAVRGLATAPDVLLVEATGRDHPRRAGLALHLGAVVGLPTVGVTHRPLLAQGPWPSAQRGATSPLTLDGELVGAWVRTRAGARPVAAHVGWRTSLDVAVDVVLNAAGRYRTPEPLRHARRLSREARLAG